MDCGETDNFNSKWIKQQIIGSGIYGEVYKGINTTNSEPIAMKKIRVPTTEDGIPIETLREIVILRNMNHSNIVK